MSLECVQFLNTFISRESTFIKLFEATVLEREAINEVLDLLSLVETIDSPKRRHNQVKSISHSILLNSLGEPEDVATNKIIEIRELACEMEELIGILKSG